VNPRLQSGATILKRELSSGKQDYDIDRMKDKQVFCALTIADAPGKIEKIEFEKALVNVLIIIHRG
jgi:hypothetical protein